jgi:hypothetical protein
MRKLAVTTFAVLYALMAISLSAQHSLSRHPAGHTSHHLGKAERTDSLLYEKKLLKRSWLWTDGQSWQPIRYHRGVIPSWWHMNTA